MAKKPQFFHLKPEMEQSYCMSMAVRACALSVIKRGIIGTPEL